jgi:hypothetical protein
MQSSITRPTITTLVASRAMSLIDALREWAPKPVSEGRRSALTTIYTSYPERTSAHLSSLDQPCCRCLSWH